MYSEIAANKRKTVVVMTVFVVVIGLLGWLLSYLFQGGYSLTFGVIIGAVIYTALTYFAGSSMALALNGAHQIQKADNPRLWRVVENLAITTGLPMPKVYIIDDPAPNAFATGRKPETAVVCATSGLLDMMSDTELEGVMAHELSHVKNYDIRVSMVAFALTAAISLLADVLLRATFFRDRDSNTSPIVYLLAIVGAILAPLVATLVQLAVSRRREYLADASGALATRYPEGLASALEKIEQYGQPMHRQNTSTAHLFFVNPLKGKSLMNLFSTHPPIEERIARLRDMNRHE